MLKYILVHRKYNLDIPISTFKCPLVTGFTVTVTMVFLNLYKSMLEKYETTELLDFYMVTF